MVSGVIQKINDRQFGNKTFYSLALSGQDGWYGTGPKRPPAIGTSVKFNEKTNNKGYKEVDGSIEIISDGQSGSTGSVASTATKIASTGGTGQSAYWDRKEARDITNDSARELGASRNTAIAFIDLAIKNEVIKLPAAAKREEFLWTLLNKYTDRLMGKTSDRASPEDITSESTNTPVSNDPETDNWS